MRRMLTIIAVIWRFRIDDMVLASLPGRWPRGWRKFMRRQSSTPPAQRLRLALEYLGPIFVKFGQLLSTRPDLLPPEYITELAKLQDRVPPESAASMRAAIEKSLRQPLTEIFSEFDDTPVGSASVAQVHRARLHHGDEVAVKILRPNVHRRIQRDLQLMRGFAGWAERWLSDGELLRPRAVVEEFARHLDNETRLLREASHCAQIGRNLSASPMVVVPRVYWSWCREQVMVMEYIAARPISDQAALDAAGVDLSILAKNGIELFFSQVFRDNFFHADMHPGNVHVDARGRFVLLDYGIVGSLTDFDKEYLARNFIAFFNRDYHAVARMHVDAGWLPPHTPVEVLESDIRAVCEPIFAKPLKDISFGRFLLQMFQVARRFQLRVQPQLLLLQKTLLNVEGMGRALDPNINLWDTAKPFLEKWARQQYNFRRVVRTLQRQTPDWLAIIDELPSTARLLLRQAHLPPDDHKLRELQKSRRFWRLVAGVVSSVLMATIVGAIILVLR